MRGGGIYQRGMDLAVEKLDDARLVHIFPEGAVNVTRTTAMRRFKWGIARLVLEPVVRPVVVPIWLSGFDQIMPEPRAKPTWLPRTGAELCVAFGEPVAPAVLAPFTASYAKRDTWTSADASWPAVPASVPSDHLYPPGEALRPEDTPAYAALRSRLAAVLHDELTTLGQNTRRRLGQGDGEGTLRHRPDLVGVDYKTDVPT